MINLRSDNEVGAHPRIIEAVSRAFTSGSAFSYGADEWTQRVENRLREIFEKPDLVAYPGRHRHRRQRAGARLLHAALGLGLLPSRRPHRGRGDQRARVLLRRAPGARSTARPARSTPRSSPRRSPSRSTAWCISRSPSAVSITQATEHGTVYAPEEIAAIATCRASPRAEAAHGRCALRQRPLLRRLHAGRADLEGRHRRAEPRRHQERRHGGRGRDLLQLRAGQRTSNTGASAAATCCPRCGWSRPSSTPTSPTACGSTMPATPTPWRAGWSPG